MNKFDVSLSKNKLFITDEHCSNPQITYTIISELMKNGYVPSSKVCDTLITLSVDNLSEVYKSVIKMIENNLGTGYSYDPMYPNFPNQVLSMSESELYFNALIHYYTYGRFLPNYKKELRKIDIEPNIKYQFINICSEKEYIDIFNNIINSKESVSNEDIEILEYFLKEDVDLPDEIPNKEISAIVCKNFLFDKRVYKYIKTSNDVLRIVTALSDGDISLSENTRFKSLPRKQRRIIVSLLEKVIKEDDLKKHYNKWVKLFHSLHIGEYKTARKCNFLAQKIRDNKNLETFNSQVEKYILEKDNNVILLLKTRPSEFARRFHKLLHIFPTGIVTDEFISVIDKVPNKILMQLYGFFKHYGESDFIRVAFPKGNTQKVHVLENNFIKYNSVYLCESIFDELEERFSKLEPLGNVYIDKKLYYCPLPTQVRSMSKGKFNVARGTKLELPSDNCIRMFIHWIGEDIDLSCTFHKDDFSYNGFISYTNLRDKHCCHSGDITYAPEDEGGASEFIDLDIDYLLKKGTRYVSMNVQVYEGPTFKEHEVCFCGFMTRNMPNSNEIYEPNTVKYKIDLTSNTKNSIPVIFDLKERKVIYTDVSFQGDYINNVENNESSIISTLKAFSYIDNKMNLYELFNLHGLSRGKIVNDIKKADTIFSIDEGITPFDINKINSEFI